MFDDILHLEVKAAFKRDILANFPTLFHNLKIFMISFRRQQQNEKWAIFLSQKFQLASLGDDRARYLMNNFLSY